MITRGKELLNSAIKVTEKNNSNNNDNHSGGFSGVRICICGRLDDLQISNRNALDLHAPPPFNPNALSAPQQLPSFLPAADQNQGNGVMSDQAVGGALYCV